MTIDEAIKYADSMYRGEPVLDTMRSEELCGFGMLCRGALCFVKNYFESGLAEYTPGGIKGGKST